jgi:geranylgeranyl transferase type-2 subunit beta
VVRFVTSRRRDDGGFVEVAPMRRSGTNPTAAAVGLLQLVEDEVPALTPALKSSAAGFLVGVSDPSGGLKANARAPLSDLLSSFTGAWTLEQLGELARLDREGLRRFALSLERPEGGFHGVVAFDEGSDVEYTFYGIGLLSLLS